MASPQVRSGSGSRLGLLLQVSNQPALSSSQLSPWGCSCSAGVPARLGRGAAEAREAGGPGDSRDKAVPSLAEGSAKCRLPGCEELAPPGRAGPEGSEGGLVSQGSCPREAAQQLGGPALGS